MLSWQADDVLPQWTLNYVGAVKIHVQRTQFLLGMFNTLGIAVTVYYNSPIASVGVAGVRPWTTILGWLATVSSVPPSSSPSTAPSCILPRSVIIRIRPPGRTGIPGIGLRWRTPRAFSGSRMNSISTTEVTGREGSPVDTLHHRTRRDLLVAQTRSGET